MADDPRLGSTLCHEREFNRLGRVLGRVLDKVSALNGGEPLANGEEVRIAGVGSFGTRSRPARTGRIARTGEAVSISMSPSCWGRKGSQGCVECRLEVVDVGWPQIPTWNATDTPDMETTRLRYDDGPLRASQLNCREIPMWPPGCGLGCGRPGYAIAYEARRPWISRCFVQIPTGAAATELTIQVHTGGPQINRHSP